MIEIKNLTKSYLLRDGERRYVFRDLNFSFPEGANIGLIGPNGAGKSTLLRLIGGIDIPDRGRIITNKRLSWPMSLSGGLQGTMTARDSVKFVCRLLGTDREEMREKIHFVQDFAEIGEYFDQPISTYSSGMRARVKFGLSWAFDFDYYLMDEVGAPGDARFRLKSEELMAQKVDKSNVILVSHSMGQIARLCNVVVLLNKGKVTLFQDVKEGILAYEAIAEPSVRKRMPGRGAGVSRNLENLGAKNAVPEAQDNMPGK